MDSRRVRQVIHPSNVLERAGPNDSGAGPNISGTWLPLKRSIPSYILDYPDPFLLLDHFAWDDPSEYRAGFPQHPHRGLETVTCLLDGVWEDRDSLGNTFDLAPGDVLWLTAGSGVLHEELPQAAAGSARVEGFQLWINLPGYLKKSRPQYRHLPAAGIPQVERGDGSTVRVICGEVDGEIGPVQGVASDPTLLDVSLPPGCHFSLSAPSGYTCLAYLYRGQGQFGPLPSDEEADTEIIPAAPLAYGVPEREPLGGLAAPRLVVFEDGDLLEARTSLEPARFLILLGHPLHEPIARHGSIVMTSAEEIEDTLRDIHNGAFISPA
jgi:hypothetical protein